VAIELDDWDRDWLARAHSESEYRAKCKELMERCAQYAAELERLRGGPEIKFVAGCAYPDCLDGDGRCHLMFEGKCSGPKQERTI
jgi:hypothetical protein